MMQVRTIEMDFEYQMVRAIEQFLKDFEKSPSDFNPDEFMDFIWSNMAQFGEAVFTVMMAYTDDEDWHTQLTSRETK
jgi:hypothetical protein